MDGHMMVEVIFMMVILKIPVVYLAVVVWWAIRAEPRPPEGALAPARLPAQPPCPWCGRRRGPLRPVPCGGSPRRRRPAVRPAGAVVR